MRVCFVAYKFYESIPRMFQFASAFVERGDTVDVIALRRPGQPAFEVIDGVHVYRVQLRVVNEVGPMCHFVRMLRFVFISGLLLTKKHLTLEYQAVYVFSVPDCLVFAAIWPKLTGASVILDVYDIVPEFYMSKFGIERNSFTFRFFLLIERVSIAFCDHVTICNKIWHTRITSRSAKPSKCTTIDTTPSSRMFFPRPMRRTDGKFIIIYPGSLNWHQGVDVAVRAFARISTDVPEAEFHIYGEGPCKSFLKNLVADLRLGNKILFHDLLPTKEIVEHMAGADLAIVPKRSSSEFGNEAASTKIPEFMALGIPVIAAKTKIDSEYYTDRMVKFFRSENEKDLATCILLLYRNDVLRNWLVDNAKKYISENNWETKKQQYLTLVDSLIRGPHSSKPAIRPIVSVNSTQSVETVDFAVPKLVRTISLPAEFTPRT
jgi:glycosyltransferase involved in cell wall biosynthesis